MRSDPSIETQLRELHAPRGSLPEPREDAVLAAWSQRYESGDARGPDGGDGRDGGGRWGVLALFAAHRLAVAFGLLAVLIVGACVLPTSYDVPLGLSLEIRAAAGAQIPAREIAQYVQERSGASEVDVMVRQHVDDVGGGSVPAAEMMIRLWDQGLALGELEPELREAFPSLADAEIEEIALEGEVEMMWGRRLVHRALHVDLREVDIERARHELLLELHAQGFEHDEVVVEVRDREDGHREVEVKIEGHRVDEHGPGFEWVMDPKAPREEPGAELIELRDGGVDLEVPEAGEPVKIHLRRREQDPG